MATDQLKAHLEFFEELGVKGVRREAEWRGRRDPGPRDRGTGDMNAAAPLHTAPPLNTAAPPAGALDAPAATAIVAPTVPLFMSQDQALAALRDDIGADCSRCKLHTLGRRQIVFGVGNANAELMFVGEAPGADEDIQGEPFVGRAGQLLTKIIEAIGLGRSDVYIANVIKCRPPGNRNPEPDEVEQCEPFLFRQIDTIKPKVVVALGKFAAQCLLKTDEPISKLRGREFRYRDAILMPTFHPA